MTSPVWPNSSPVCVCVTVSVCVCVIWDIKRLLDPSVSCMSTTSPVVCANNSMPTWAGWSTDNPEVKQVFQSLCSLVCNLLCFYSFDTLLGWATTLYTAHRPDNVDTSCADGPPFGSQVTRCAKGHFGIDYEGGLEHFTTQNDPLVVP